MKRHLVALLRALGLIQLADKIRFVIMYLRTWRSRKAFRAANPDAVLPPPYYLYETFNLNYQSFYNTSLETAEWLVSHFERHVELKNLKILDWGCGPGRVIRHMPKVLGNTCEYYGSDYNKKYIAWCQANIPQVTFAANDLAPPMVFEPDMFDIIYGISIFTHLSKASHRLWYDELIRVTKPGGILFLTFHGDAFKERLTDAERSRYEQGKLVQKENTKEGHRTYAAFHPVPFVQELVKNDDVLEHIPGTIIDNQPQQDKWIIRKR
jgi:SAM-dependent methyltransferase